MKNLLLSALLSCPLAFSPSLAAQDVWTDEHLEKEIRGFTEETTQVELETVAHLLTNQQAAFLAICNRIHGNHAEYLLRIEKLLDELSNERWEVRERAEDTLVEIGAKGKELIERRANKAEILEERHRAARVIQRINADTSDKEERVKQMLRGLALTAFYMKPHPKLTRALVSALKHTDSLVVDRCVRALGRHGGDAEAEKLVALLDTQSTTHGLTIRASLARIAGRRGRDFIVAQIQGGKLGETETMDLVRILRSRKDGAEAMASLRSSKQPMVAQAASLPAPEAGESKPVTIAIELPDEAKTVVHGEFGGYEADTLRLDKPRIIKAKEQVKLQLASLNVPLNRCRGIRILGASKPKVAAGERVFLTQGTLVTGKLHEVTPESVGIETFNLGNLKIERRLVQGLAIDPKLDRLLGSSHKTDKVRFSSDKLQAASIVALDQNSLRYRDEKGEEQTSPRAEISGLLFKRPLQVNVDTRTFTRINTKRGDRLLGHLIAVHDNAFGILIPEVGMTLVKMDDIVELEFEMGGGAMWGFTLVADYSDNRIVEFDDQGRKVFEINEIFGVWDVECLDNGNLLITEFSLNQISEVTRDNKKVWVYDDLKNPYDADRLPNGNTLIADTFGRRVIEVNKEKEIVWKYDKDINPYDVDRLPNGNTLIADTNNDRVIEVDPKGKIVWELKEVPNVYDADRLPNGNTLLTIRMLYEVREVDPAGKTVMSIQNLSSPSDADRLPNGNTLVAENGAVREFDRFGKEVAKRAITWAVEVNRY